MGLEANCIYEGLYQGSAPEPGPEVAAEGFDTIVLCAKEWQPPKSYDLDMGLMMGYQGGTEHPYPGVTIVHAPNDDNPLVLPSRDQLNLAIKAATYVAERLGQGKKVLVTCRAGKNRSGLVSALALHKHTGLSGKLCVAIVKIARPIAFTNPQFVAVLERIPAKPQQGPANVARLAGGPGEPRILLLPPF